MPPKVGQIVRYQDAKGTRFPAIIEKIVSGSVVDLRTWGYKAAFGYQSVAYAPSNAFWGNGEWAGPLFTQALISFDDYCVVKAASEDRVSSPSLADDAELVIAVPANVFVRFHFRIYFTTPAAADFKFDLQGPAVGFVRYKQWWAVGATAPSLANNALLTAFGSAESVTGTGTDGWVEVEGCGFISEAGSITFRWAQNTTNTGATSVLKGSSVTYAICDSG